MASTNLHPLRLNALTNEPYLPLQTHQNIVMTPLRWDDGPVMINALNNPAVSPWLANVPTPYLPEHAESWLARVIPPADEALAALRASRDARTDQTVVGALRIAHPDGSVAFIGHIAFFRLREMELVAGNADMDQETLAALASENETRPAGDPDIVWTVGYWLSPEYQGRGIMQDALETLLYRWAVPRMGVRKAVGITCDVNIGSMRTMERAGFNYRQTLRDDKIIKGVMRNTVVLDWVDRTSA